MLQRLAGFLLLTSVKLGMIAFKPRIVNIFYKKIPDKSLHFHVIFMFFPDPAKDVPGV